MQRQRQRQRQRERAAGLVRERRIINERAPNLYGHLVCMQVTRERPRQLLLGSHPLIFFHVYYNNKV